MDHNFLLSTSDTEVLKMKMVLESLASSNDEKVPRDVTNCCCGSDSGECDTTSLCSAGTEDQRAGGISQQAPERAGAGQRLEPHTYHQSQHIHTFLCSFTELKNLSQTSHGKTTTTSLQMSPRFLRPRRRAGSQRWWGMQEGALAR